MTDRTHSPAALPAVLCAILSCLLLLLPETAQACRRRTPPTAQTGAYSPSGVAGGPTLAVVDAGLACTPSVLLVGGTNYVYASFSSLNNRALKLDGGTATIPYVASADPEGNYAFTGTTQVNYWQNNLLNLLGLLGDGERMMPLYLRIPAGTAAPAPGLYKDTVTIRWEWRVCDVGLGALLCLNLNGSPTGTYTTTFDVELRVTRDLQITTVVTTRWDPIRGTANPIDLPGSRQSIALRVTNLDPVALGTDSVYIEVPIAANQALVLGADDSGTNQTITFDQASSGLTMAFGGGGSTSDNVEFSTDGGGSWSYHPIDGSATSLGRVNRIRLHPRGGMAASSNFTIELPVRVR